MAGPNGEGGRAEGLVPGVPQHVEPKEKLHTSVMPSGPDCSDDILWEQSGWHNLCMTARRPRSTLTAC